MYTTREVGALAVPGESREIAWENDALESFESRMLATDQPFPCVFGVDAVRRRTLRYAFVGAGDQQAEQLARALREFAGVCEELGRRTSLVVFLEDLPGADDLSGSESAFWELMHGVRQHDDQPWPESISTDTESSTWEFSVFGVPFFVVVNTPYHEHRRSRHFDYLAITFQPRFVFDDLAEETPTGRNSRKVIRGRLDSYDSVDPHPSLGGFGHESNREWVQYFLPDDNTVVPTHRRCPLGHTTQGETDMTRRPSFDDVDPIDLPKAIVSMLPDQGSIEIQNDGPGKTFTWHRHSVDEELSVLDGHVTLFWCDADGTYRERGCEPGVRIALPAGTLHGSVAGPAGGVYVIRPMGPSPQTEFLAEADWPFTVPTPQG